MKLKKLVCLFTALSLSLGLIACGNTEKKESEVSEEKTDVVESTDESEVSEESSEEEPVVDENSFAGKHFKISMLNFQGWTAEEVKANYADDRSVLMAALEEFCYLNDCTYELVDIFHSDKLMASIAAGAQPDIIFGAGTLPLYGSLGLVEDLTDVADEFREKYGANITDSYKQGDATYGFASPVQDSYLFQYNATWFEELGVKSPRDYMMEDNWTWESFAQLMSDLTRDNDGDGVIDMAATGTGYIIAALCPAYVMDTETGKIISTLEDEMSYEFYDMLYKAYTEDHSFVEGHMWGTGNINGVECMMANMPYFDVNLGVANSGVGQYGYWDGVIESVPMPVYADDPFYTAPCKTLSIVKGRKDDATVALLDFIIGSLWQHKDICPDGTADEYVYIEGNTEMGKAYLEAMETSFGEIQKRIVDLRATDPDTAAFYDKITNYFNEVRYVPEVTVNGISSLFEWPMIYPQLLTTPAASSIAEIAPILQSLIDTYNSNYVFE